MEGTIPTELGSLTKLYQLKLYDNALSGAVPSQLTGLAELTTLWLSGNQLSGPLPDLTLLTKVTFLRLRDNGCLSSGSVPLTTWLDGLDPLWDDGCPP